MYIFYLWFFFIIQYSYKITLLHPQINTQQTWAVALQSYMSICDCAFHNSTEICPYRDDHLKKKKIPFNFHLVNDAGVCAEGWIYFLLKKRKWYKAAGWRSCKQCAIMWNNKHTNKKKKMKNCRWNQSTSISKYELFRIV